MKIKTDEEILLHFNKSLSSLNKYFNLDMKNLTDWLKANKVSLNYAKTELVMLTLKKKTEFPIKWSLEGKDSVPQNLNWKDHIHDAVTKT